MKSTNSKIIITSVLTLLLLSAVTICFIVIGKKSDSKDTSSPTDAISTPLDVSDNEIITEYTITENITELSPEMVSQPLATNSDTEEITTEDNTSQEADSNQDKTEADETDTDGDGIVSGKFIPDDLINTDIQKNYVKPAYGPSSITTPDGAPVDIVSANPVSGALNPGVVATSPAACGNVGGDYFNDAVFIGNSRTEGLMIYTGVTGTNLAYTGLNVKTAYTTNAIRVNGTKVPVMTALQSTSFSKAYVMFGVNEVGWMSADTFISYYRNIIQDIKAVNPNAVIYIQSMLPVTASFEAERGTITNAKIYEFNTYLKGLADEQGVYFLNIAEVIADETGYLPSSASPDGYHLNPTYCNIWYEYLKSHAVQ